MPQLLISVTSVKEAEIALQCGADIIDLKDPAHGALGALPLATINEITNFVQAQSKPHNKLVSATIGDLPMQPNLLLESVNALSATQVDIIKIGFFKTPACESSVYQTCLDALATACVSGLKLVAVLFAEYTYPENLLTAISNAGFYGVMYDTAEKNGATFQEYFTVEEIHAIANTVQVKGIMFGIAGSLCLEHVAAVKEIAPDYIGFRGGVCLGNQRRAQLSPEKIKELRELM